MAGNRPSFKHLTLLEEPQKEYTLPKVQRHPLEDAFDEIEILGFPVSVSPFDLLQTKYRGNVIAKDLTKYHKKQVKMLAYLISRKTRSHQKRDDVFRNYGLMRKENILIPPTFRIIFHNILFRVADAIFF